MNPRMTSKHFPREVAPKLIPLVGCGCLLFLASSSSSLAQAVTEHFVALTSYNARILRNWTSRTIQMIAE
jgi:hypothetical protein